MAYSDIQWGNTIQGSSTSRQGKIGISYELLNYTTSITVNVRVYFWSKYSISDTNNNFYADWNSDCSTNHGSVSVKTTSSSGSGWSTTNQIIIATYSNSYSKTSSAKTEYFSAKLSGIDNLGSGTMSTSVSFTISALPTYTVTFNLNGGTLISGSTSQTISYNGSATAPSVSRTGYTFAGWSGTYTNVTSNKTITATWTANKYVVTFDPNEGDVDITSLTVVYDSVYGTFPTPTRDNYTFQGWFTDPIDGSRVLESQIVSITSNQTLYAHWVLDGYSIIYYNHDKTVFATQVVAAGMTGTLLSDIPILFGYTFMYWNTKPNGSGTSYYVGDSITLIEDIALYPLMYPWQYTVIFDANGGDGDLPFESGSVWDSLLEFKLPTSSLSAFGKKFVGWNTKSDGTGTFYYPGNIFKDHQDGGTVTLFAMYQNTEIYFYKNGVIECIEFIEDNTCTSPYLTKDGSIIAYAFIEHDGDIMFEKGIVYAKNFIEKEKSLVSGGASNPYLLDSSDTILIDKNYYTLIEG